MQRMPWFTKQHVVATLLALALLLAAAPVAAQPAPTTAPDIATIDRYIADEMRAQHIPGLALGIVQGDQIVYLKGFGVADPSRRAITPQTPFPISKLSKTFTALAVMQLVEAGKIELDAPVQRYIPWFRVSTAAAPAGITVRHLLTETSGLSHAAGLESYAAADLRDDALEQHARDLSTAQRAHPVGAAYEDTSANAWVLGLLIQTVAAHPYAAYVQQQIFAPLDMRQSFTSSIDAQPHGLPLAITTGSGVPSRRPAVQPWLPAGFRSDRQRRGSDPLPGGPAERGTVWQGIGALCCRNRRIAPASRGRAGTTRRMSYTGDGLCLRDGLECSADQRRACRDQIQRSAAVCRRCDAASDGQVGGRAADECRYPA
jgi:CubicO group peptidase (beta-lactamase class C family)